MRLIDIVAGVVMLASPYGVYLFFRALAEIAFQLTKLP